MSPAINPLNAELNPICHLLALLGGANVVVVSRLRVKASRHHYTFIRSVKPAIRVRTLNTSVMRSDYLFCVTNRGRCTQRLAFEIRGQRAVLKKGGDILLQSVTDTSRCFFVKSHTRLFLQ